MQPSSTVAIANLDKVGSAFTTVLKTEETGDDAVEIDFGDVLLLKSSLYMLKAVILISAAYNLDADLRQLAILGNAGVIQFHRDLLDKYPDLLRLRTTDGIALLAGAQQALLAGIDAFDAAFDSITSEIGPAGERPLLLRFGRQTRSTVFSHRADRAEKLTDRQSGRGIYHHP